MGLFRHENKSTSLGPTFCIQAPRSPAVLTADIENPSSVDKNLISTMNFTQLVDSVAQRTGLPVGLVNKIGLAILEQIREIVETEESLHSPFIVITSKTIPASESPDGTKIIPERRIGRITITPRRSKVSS